MVDLESMLIALRLAWLKRVLGEKKGFWKEYLKFQLKRFGDLFLLSCDFGSVKISSLFYQELLN